MITTLNSLALLGLEAVSIKVEVDIRTGKQVMVVVGLGDTAIQEARDRVITAIKNSKLILPQNKRITVNLAPADLKKEGAGYDLPIALGILSSDGRLNLAKELTDKAVFIGELALDGRLRHVDGVLPLTLGAKKLGYEYIFVPAADAREASLVAGIKIVAVESLAELIGFLKRGSFEIVAPVDPYSFMEDMVYDFDMGQVKGQEHAKRALEIAAAGGHNVLMTGPPGSGKTLLARAFRSILPRLSREELLEVTKIYSIAGLLSLQKPLILERPFRTPHHTASAVSLVGGGKIPRPGEISLAHHGVLFLDELPEFPKSVLEVLRQPLEDRIITISRVQGILTFPASFTLVAAMNPCPCGFATDPEKECICSAILREHYRRKISGPLLDRIDLHVAVPRLAFSKLHGESDPEPSEKIRYRVEQARLVQANRFTSTKINSSMGAYDVRKFCKFGDEVAALLHKAVDTFHLSARGFHRTLKISRTIADLAGAENIKVEHVAEALQYRMHSG